MTERTALLVAHIDADLAGADRLVARLAEKPDIPVDVDASWRGYTLHNLYSALERLFERIARTFENQVEDVSRYHAELLRRMMLDVPQVRPAVLSRASYDLLNELRAFRHLFRHGYEVELEPERVERLATRVCAGWPAIRNDIDHFRSRLLADSD